MLKIVYGNDFRMRMVITHPEHIDDHTIIEDFDITKCSDVKINLVCEKHKILIPLTYELELGSVNTLIIQVIGSQLEIGSVYGLQLTGKDEDERAFRWKASGDEMFCIIDNTSGQDLNNEILIDNINAVIGLVGAQGPQGVKGEDGAQGAKGEDGAQGPQGIQGPQGSSTIEPVYRLNIRYYINAYVNKFYFTEINVFNTLTNEQVFTSTSRADMDWQILMDYLKNTYNVCIDHFIINGLNVHLLNPWPDGTRYYLFISNDSNSNNDLKYNDSLGLAISYGNINQVEYIYLPIISNAFLSNTYYTKTEIDAMGVQGPQGNEGPQGPKGEDGAQGPQGNAGIDGAQGPQGNAGIDGAQGPQGNAGIDGVQGPQGVAGIDGVQGPQGVAGIDGVQGPQGDVGADGVQGPQGDVGADGVQGPQGDAGIDGVQGPQGDAGIDGVQGPQGVAGIDGVQGPQGPQGTVDTSILDDYETKADFNTKELVISASLNDLSTRIDNIILTPGPQGPQGPQGPSGDTTNYGRLLYLFPNAYNQNVTKTISDIQLGSDLSLTNVNVYGNTVIPITDTNDLVKFANRIHPEDGVFLGACIPCYDISNNVNIDFCQYNEDGFTYNNNTYDYHCTFRDANSNGWDLYAKITSNDLILNCTADIVITFTGTVPTNSAPLYLFLASYCDTTLFIDYNTIGFHGISPTPYILLDPVTTIGTTEINWSLGYGYSNEAKILYNNTTYNLKLHAYPNQSASYYYIYRLKSPN